MKGGVANMKALGCIILDKRQLGKTGGNSQKNYFHFHLGSKPRNEKDKIILPAFC